MKKFGISCNEPKKDEPTGVLIAILILCAISVVISIVRLVYDVFSDKLKSGEDLIGYDRYDYDQSDICDTDDDLEF